MNCRNKYFLLIIFTFFFAFSCGTANKAFVKKKDRNWAETQLPEETLLAHTIYIVGDAGKADDKTNYTNFVLDAVKKEVAAANENSSLVYLGDNLYPAGLAPETDPDHERGKSILKMQLDVVEKFKGATYFIPGNHDWNHWRAGGLEAIKRQEKFVENYFDEKEKVKLVPDNGCGDPVTVKIHKDLVLFFIDSQWWLQDWENEPDINEGCKIKSRQDFLNRMEELFSKHRNDQIALFLHHPIYSNGTHNGNFSLKDHIFPLTTFKKNLYIPLPVIGSLYPLARKFGVTNQDITNSFNKELMNGIVALAEEIKNDVIFISGHEHSLQYFDKEKLDFIISGSACKMEFAKRGGKATYVHQRRGFSKLYFYTNNEVWLEFFVLDNNNNTKTSFRKQLTPPKAGSVSVAKKNYPPIQPGETVKLAANAKYAKGKFAKFWIGEQYREEWATPVEVPVIDLETIYGGLKPIKKGGGLSTNSLRLEAKDGKQYVLRSLVKDYTRIFPTELKRLKAINVLQDQVSADHPYGHLSIPRLSEAVGIYYARPKLFYLRKHKGLGNYNPFFHEGFYYLEERPRGNWSDAAFFGNAKNIISYIDVFDNLRKKKIIS